MEQRGSAASNPIEIDPSSDTARLEKIFHFPFNFDTPRAEEIAQSLELLKDTDIRWPWFINRKEQVVHDIRLDHCLGSVANPNACLIDTVMEFFLRWYVGYVNQQCFLLI